MGRGRPKQSGFLADFNAAMSRERYIQPYSDLQPSSKRGPLELIKRTAAYLPGGDYDAAVADLRNSVDFVSKMKKLCGDSGCGGAKTLKNKEFRVKIAQLFLPEFSLRELQTKGIDIGKHLYFTTAKHFKNGGSVFAYGTSRAGRKTHEKKGAVADEWVLRSEPTRQICPNGNTARRIFGSLRTYAIEISKKYDVSLATAYNFRPDFVVKRENILDLCIYCETLMELRLKAIKIANGLGAKIGIGSTYPGHNLALTPGQEATKFLREDRGNLDDAATEI